MQTREMAHCAHSVFPFIKKNCCLQFQAADQLDADGLKKNIMACIYAFGLDYKTNLVGQGYDRASVMSGRKSGVATRIQEVCRFAVYIHCYVHRLNLVLVDATKSVSEAGDFSSLLERLYVFLSDSYVHNKQKSIQQEMYSSYFELRRLSDTRWSCRYYSCHAVFKRMPAILRVMDELIGESNPDRAIDARGLRAQFDFQFLTMLSVFNTILGKSKSAADILQATNPDLAKVTDVVEGLKDEMKELRTKQDGFESVWCDAIGLAKSCNIVIPQEGEQITGRGRCQTTVPTKLRASILYSPLVDHRCGHSKDSFKIEVLYPIIDTFISELDRRFSTRNCYIMGGIQALSPTNEQFLALQKVKPFAEVFEANMDDLKHELHQEKRLLE